MEEEKLELSKGIEERKEERRQNVINKWKMMCKNGDVPKHAREGVKQQLLEKYMGYIEFEQ